MGWLYPAGSQARHASGVIAFPAIGPALAISYKAWLKCRNVDALKKIFAAAEILVFDFELFIGVRCVCVYSLNARVFLPQSPEAPSVLVNHKWDHYGEETNDSFKVDLPLPRAYNHYYGR